MLFSNMQQIKGIKLEPAERGGSTDRGKEQVRFRSPVAGKVPAGRSWNASEPIFQVREGNIDIPTEERRIVEPLKK